MQDYRFLAQQNDGTWVSVDLKCADDDDAVAFGLIHRTANACELFCGERPLATFDGLGASQPATLSSPHRASPLRLELVS